MASLGNHENHPVGLTPQERVLVLWSAKQANHPMCLMYASRLHGRVIMRAPTSASLKALLPMVSTCFLHVTGTNQPPVLCDADCSITDTTSTVAQICYVRALFDTCNRRSPLIMPCKLATVSGNALAPLMLTAQGGMLLYTDTISGLCMHICILCMHPKLSPRRPGLNSLETVANCIHQHARVSYDS